MRRCWIWQQINRIQCLFSLELKFFTFFNIFFWDFSFNYFFFFLLLWVGIPRIRTRFLNIPYWSLWMGMIKFIHWFSSKSLNIYRNLSRIRDDPLFFCVHQLWYTFLCLTLLQYKAFKVGFLNHIYIYIWCKNLYNFGIWVSTNFMENLCNFNFVWLKIWTFQI